MSDLIAAVAQMSIALILLMATVYLIVRDILVRREDKRKEREARARLGMPARRIDGKRRVN